MTILIQTPLKNEEIKTLLTAQPQGGITFVFSSKRGITLAFEAVGGTADQAVAVVKSVIKATDWGKVLYFSVTEG